MLVIGEKINGTRSEVAQAIQARDSQMIQHLALSQVAAGAGYLDVNAGTHPKQEPEDMVWLINTIQDVVDVPLCLDSANPEALKAGLAAVNKPPMINSLSGEKARIEGVLPLACEHKTRLIVLALDDNGIPKTVEDRVAIVERLVKMTRQGGLPDDYLYVDPLVITIATDNASGRTAFETIRRIKARYPEIHFTCGLSNISFGQPSRTLINQAFAALAIQAGLDSAIVDPEEKGLRNIIYSAELVLGLDPHCKNYNKAHRNGLVGAPTQKAGEPAPAASDSQLVGALKGLVSAMASAGILDLSAAPASDAAPALTGSIPAAQAAPSQASADDDRIKGMIEAMVAMDEEKVDAMVKEWLDDGKDPLRLLDASRDAMVEVGRLFDAKEYFVPELILAGEILSAISTAVKPYLKSDAGDSAKKGRVIIATVEGDIHDIGKDIVVTMLDINGYDVLDLGVDVPVAKVVEAAKEFKPQVIGLSGFLTLAYDPMKFTITAVKEAMGNGIHYMIGGGQMDDEVAKYVGADAFGKDAMEAVKLCDKWILGGNA